MASKKQERRAKIKKAFRTIGKGVAKVGKAVASAYGVNLGGGAAPAAAPAAAPVPAVAPVVPPAPSQAPGSDFLPWVLAAAAGAYLLARR